MANVDEKTCLARHESLEKSCETIQSNVSDLHRTLHKNGFQARITSIETQTKMNTKLMFLILSTLIIFALGSCGGVYMIMKDLDSRISLENYCGR